MHAQYLCDYFNYYFKDNPQIVWRSRLHVGDYYTALRFYFDEEEDYFAGKTGLVGLMGVEKLNSRLLIQNKILLFDESGFQVVQTKEKSNWALGKAKKMAAEITREILMTGGSCDEK